ncbi:hypothetical protein DIPPA_10717 [Diplonema papillatum]|nr:hypothetical protein DIPPA_10717 [Diplonema papillatum]
MSRRLLFEITLTAGVIMAYMRPIIPTAAPCPPCPTVAPAVVHAVPSGELSVAAARQMPEPSSICSSLQHDRLVIKASGVRKFSSKQDWRHVDICCHWRKEFDDMNRKHLFAAAGKEHYPLLGYLSIELARRGSQLFVELGTRESASAVALAEDARNAVFTLDIFDAARHAARTLSQHRRSRVLPLDLQLTASNIHYVCTDVLNETVSATATYRRLVLGARVLLLDTHHHPETMPFEYEFLKFLEKNGFGGLIILDDIFLNPEMKRLWRWCNGRYGDRAIDATSIAHATGTGMIDFCNNTVVLFNE